MCMISSMTSSSNDYSETEKMLRGFLEGVYTLDQVKRVLEPRLIFDFDDHEKRREILRNELAGAIKIPVDETHVRKTLERYLEGKLSATDVSDWAAFVYLTEVFVPKGDTEEARWLAGEGPTWDVLQRLMTPSLFGGLNEMMAKEYIEMLL